MADSAPTGAAAQAEPQQPQQPQQQQYEQQGEVQQQQQQQQQPPPQKAEVDDGPIFIDPPRSANYNPFKPYYEPGIRYVEDNGWFLLFAVIILWFFKSRIEAWKDRPARLDKATETDVQERMRKRREEQLAQWEEQNKEARKEKERAKAAKKHDEIKKNLDKYDPDRHFKADRVRRPPPSSGGAGSGPRLRDEFRAARRPARGG